MQMYDRFLAYLLSLFGPADANPWGFWRYDSNQHWDNGVTLHYDADRERAEVMHNGRFAIEVPGMTIEAMEPAKWLEFMRTAVRYFGVRASRLDVFFDDRDRTITPAELVAAVREIGPEGRLQKADWCGPKHCDPRIESDLFEVRSAAVNFGTRGKNGGESYLRCYDKALESAGENKAVRWERELSDHKAQLAVDYLLEALDDGLDAVAGMIGRLITGAIDFRYRSEKPAEKNLARLRRYPFWATIVQELSGRVRLAGRQIRKTVTKAKRYFEDQLTATVQMLREAMGAGEFFSWFADRLDEPGRLRQRHRIAIAEHAAAVAAGLIQPDG